MLNKRMSKSQNYVIINKSFIQLTAKAMTYINHITYGNTAN